jgi:hypothetical protein
VHAKDDKALEKRDKKRMPLLSTDTYYINCLISTWFPYQQKSLHAKDDKALEKRDKKRMPLVFQLIHTT